MVPRAPALLLLLLLAAPRDGAPIPQSQANRTAAPMPAAQTKAFSNIGSSCFEINES